MHAVFACITAHASLMSLHVGVGCLNLNVEQQCKMPKAYSEDLRWRAVWSSLVRGMSYSDIATVLFMSEKSVYRYISFISCNWDS